MTQAWLLFQLAGCAVLIARAGYVLSRSADALADTYGWGRGWVGLALLATVTSLPELASGLSAVAIVGAPNLAIGNSLGACVVNLLFLVVVDALQRDQPMYREASATHLLSAGFGVVMLGFVAMSLLTGTRAPIVLHIGIYSPILLALYLLALKSVHGHECEAMAARAATPNPASAAQTRREWRRFALAALVVLAAGAWLPEVADDLANAMGLSRSFVGTVLMAVVTTLPEMAVTLGALRVGALDMAIGNLLGSNLFNVMILALDDAFYVRGPLLADAAPVHAGTAVSALVMTGLVIIGLVMRPQGRPLRVLSWVSVALVATYAVNAALVYLGGT
ncbi:sodium:calcium antiporter [Variovorax paradoxus]|jgi:cation:H+ antiporter|uniref:sodium:calcium antiporter n=1 Tax=Variovorax paradoxus TaxID=34073 RepID=UPI0029C6F5D8|nr:sodium:calcium antiporter [Variovorax paradoxus]WPH23507.1 sodium:calcium antiporter [Variovorax paradoxus]